MRGTPTSLGGCPAWRRYMKLQEFPDRPTMIGDPRGHRWRLLATCHAQTLVRRTEIIDGADQIHPMLQGQCAPCQRAAAAGQRRQALTERGIQSFDVGRVDHPGTLRTAPQRLDAREGTVNDTTFNRDYPPLHGALDDLCNADIAPRAQPGTPVGS